MDIKYPLMIAGLLIIIAVLFPTRGLSQKNPIQDSVKVDDPPVVPIRKRDRKKDVEMITSRGTLVLRLSDSTPLHQSNFIRLVKSHYLEGMLFHRVIKGFMIQSGDPNSKSALAGQALGNGGASYTVPAEILPGYFHYKGVLAAARTGDNVNPQRASSGSHFYIVQGKVFNDEGLDSIEVARLKGRKLPTEHRMIYKTMGGTPQLDQSYTIFGWLVSGVEVLDEIASVPTSKGSDKDRPLEDIKILKTRLIKRDKIRTLPLLKD